MATVLGKVVAEKLSGTSDYDLEFPVTTHKPIPFSKFYNSILPLAIGYNRVLDKLNL
jgi:hypothetical protein